MNLRPAAFFRACAAVLRWYDVLRERIAFCATVLRFARPQNVCGGSFSASAVCVFFAYERFLVRTGAAVEKHEKL